LLLVAASSALVALGHGPLAAPPITPDAFATWIAEGEPLLRVAAVARVVALGVAAWHLVSLVLVLVIDVLDMSGRVVDAVRRLSPAIVRRTVRSTGAAALAGTVTISGMLPAAGATSSPARPAAADAPVATMHWEPVDDAPPMPQPPTSTTGAMDTASSTTGQSSPTTSASVATTPTTSGHPVTTAGVMDYPTASTTPDGADVAEPTSTTTAAGAPGASPPAVPVPMRAPEWTSKEQRPARHDQGARPSTGADGSWTVERGEHLWGIARDVVAARAGGTPDANAVADYWVRLIDANRSRLVDPSNPDLIHAGLVLVLP
jgi:hypothetical protein